MAEFTTLTGRFRAIPKEKPHDHLASKVTKRPRDSTVCLQCRWSKLKCDRKHPCASCTKRGEELNCAYPQQQSSSKPDGKGGSGSNRQNLAEDRLLHLESLVKQIMENQPQAQTSHPAAPSKPVTPPSTSSDTSHETQEVPLDSSRYVGSTHWSAILDDIQELKSVLGSATSTVAAAAKPAPSTAALAFEGYHEVVFGCPDHYSLEQILSDHLPEKTETDRLLAVYFQADNFTVPFIHSFHFQRQYRAFWADPLAVNPLWLALLFSICCIATLINAALSSTTPDPLQAPKIARLHKGAALCLVLGGYHRPQPMAVEAFALYAQCKNLWTLDSSREAGAILAIVVRMAYEMGYHRDPDVLGSFTVFEAEMRRRFWSSCKQVDLMISFQLGMPSNIRLENTDTKPPSNLLDSDFDEDTKVLPPSRSETEPTRMLWFIVKDRQMNGFSKVCQDALSFHEKTEAEVLELDREIQNMYSTVPESLRARPLSESIIDPPFLIMTRVYVEFINLKSLMVLHRRYMARGVVSSTHACVAAARRLVSQCIEIFEEFAEGGQLNSVRWMLTNFTMNDFLLAVMVLCLAIHLRRKSLARAAESPIDAATETEIRGLLENAHVFCVQKSDACKDARRVARAVRLILDSARSTKQPAGYQPTASMTAGQADFANAPGVVIPSLNRASVLQTDIDHFNMPDLGDISLDHLDPFDFLGNPFDGFDWTAYV
jgi:hypothetical protein